MATPPDFSSGAVLTAAQMNSVGLWLVKTQTVGSGVASVAVTGAFTTDYDNYKIVWSNGVLSAIGETRVILGATTAGYSNSLIYGAYGGGAATVIGNAAGANWTFMGYGNTTAVAMNFELYQPFLTKNTFMSSNLMQFAGQVGGTNNGILENTTSYTGFTIFPASGTMTGGTIRIYGYRK